jgi:CRISPR-associated protein Csm2
MSIFRFRIQDLERVHRNRNDLENEMQFMKKRFKNWGVPETNAIEFAPAVLNQIVTNDDGSAAMVEWGEKLGATFKATKLTTSQIRNIFGEVRNIQQQGYENTRIRHRFYLLIPKLHYAAARAETFGMNGLRDVLEAGIKQVGDSPENFRRFVEFFEAILAYHKAYGGK